MNIIREFFPKKMPMLIQGEYRIAEDGFTEMNISSVRVHPISKTGEVLSALPLESNNEVVLASAYRLADLVAD